MTAITPTQFEEVGLLVEVIVGVGAIIFGYFKMYTPIITRLGLLESHRNDQLNKCDTLCGLHALNAGKLDAILNSQIEITTALWGHDGENGMRSRIVKLEGDVETLKFGRRHTD